MQSAMAVRGVPVATKTDQVLDYLRAALARGEIEPGQPIREQQLAAMLGMSRTPVREALRRAQITGLVQYSAYRGVTASELSTEDLVDVYRIRSRLEPLATELATPRLTSEQLARLEAYNAEIARLAADGAVESIRRANDDWHQTIYHAAGSPRLYSLITTVLAGSPRDTFTLSGRADLTVREHAQILTALRHRDAGLAATLMEAHILSAIVSFLGEREGRERGGEHAVPPAA